MEKEQIICKNKVKTFKFTEKRKQSHNILANSILEIGTIVKVENMNFKALQRRSKKTEISEKLENLKRKRDLENLYQIEHLHY